MSRTRRHLLGIALLGAAGPLVAAPTRQRVAAARLDAELAALARDPACELAPFWGRTPDGECAP